MLKAVNRNLTIALGHVYYYNAETKQSTYKRPTAPASPGPPPAPTVPEYSPQYLPPFSSTPYGPVSTTSADSQSGVGFQGGRGYQDRRHRQLEDRPKSKQVIPGCPPWWLVKTKLGRRFVHNPKTKESYWKFPEHVLKAVVELDRIEREKKERRERGEEVEQEERGAETASNEPKAAPTASASADAYDSDEYEEVEVTDDEDEEEQANKRPRTDGAGQGEDQPLEFNEEDIEYQLAAMGEEYGLEPGEYGAPGEEGYEEGAEGLPLTDEEAAGLFRDLLDDYQVNPFSPWEQIIEEGKIINDTRYTVLPNMKARREVFSEWSRERIQQIKEKKEKEEKKDPRIRYLAFLQEHATPKLYWQEFKRKYRKEEEMKHTRLSDKDREKYYREHIARLKLPESTRKSDLSALLKSVPIQQLNRSTSIEALPPAILTDIRYISLPPKIRDPLIEAYISTLPPPPEDGEELSVEEQEERRRKKEEREKRERALAERERRVEAEKRRQRGEIMRGKHLLRQEEAELEQAMRISGKDSLRSYMEDADRSETTRDDKAKV